MSYKRIWIICVYTWLMAGLTANALQNSEGKEVEETVTRFTLCVPDLTQAIRNQQGEVTETIQLCSRPEVLTQEYMLTKYPLIKEKYDQANLQNIQSLHVVKWKVGVSVTQDKLPFGAEPNYGIHPRCEDSRGYESYEIEFPYQELIQDYFLTFTLLGRLEITQSVNEEFLKNVYCCIPLYQRGVKVPLRELESQGVTLLSIDKFKVSDTGDVSLTWNSYLGNLFNNDGQADDMDEDDMNGDIKL